MGSGYCCSFFFVQHQYVRARLCITFLQFFLCVAVKIYPCLCILAFYAFVIFTRQYIKAIDTPCQDFLVTEQST